MDGTGGLASIDRPHHSSQSFPIASAFCWLTKQPSLSTSSDSLAFGGSPSPVVIRVTSIKTIAKQPTTGFPMTQAGTPKRGL